MTEIHKNYKMVVEVARGNKNLSIFNIFLKYLKGINNLVSKTQKDLSIFNLA